LGRPPPAALADRGAWKAGPSQRSPVRSDCAASPALATRARRLILPSGIRVPSFGS
jgi:hypothetical protein